MLPLSCATTFSRDRRFVSPTRFADFGRAPCDSEKGLGGVFKRLSGLLVSSLVVILFPTRSWGKVSVSESQVKPGPLLA